MALVKDLAGAELAYWATKADETWKRGHVMYPAMTLDPTFSGVDIRGGQCMLIPNNSFRQDPQPFCPHESWEHGGPIIDKKRIQWGPSKSPERGPIFAFIPDGTEFPPGAFGATILEASMRALVASEYGDEVPDQIAGAA